MKKLQGRFGVKLFSIVSFIVFAVSAVAIAMLSPYLFASSAISALIFLPGVGFGEMRGSAGSVCVSKNHAGNFIRGKVKPINPRSDYQSSVRDVLSSLAKRWKTLDENERLGWNTIASNKPIQDRLGRTITLTGEQMYIQYNANLAIVGVAVIDAPPSFIAAPTSIGDMTLTATSGAPSILTLAFETPIEAGDILAVYATPQYSAGINYAKGYKFIGFFDNTFTTTESLLSAYATRFDSDLLAGNKISIKVKVIREGSGEATIFRSTSAIIG